MTVLQILQEMKNIAIDASEIRSRQKLFNKITILIDLNSTLYEKETKLYDEIQMYINNLDVEYACSLEFNEELDINSIADILSKFNEFVSSQANSIKLDLTKTHLSGGYSIMDSLEYFKEQHKVQKVSDIDIINEGQNGFRLSGFELDKYMDYIKSNLGT